MMLDGVVECEYADVCAPSNYGNKDSCHDKLDCKLYHQMVRTELLMWEYSQPEIIPLESLDGVGDE